MSDQNQAAEDDEVFINSGAVERRYNKSAPTIYRWERDPELGFPKPLIINRRKLWRLAELVAWERSMAAVARRAAA